MNQRWAELTFLARWCVGANRNLNSFSSQCRRSTDQFNELPIWTTPVFEIKPGGQGESGIPGQFEIGANTSAQSAIYIRDTKKLLISLPAKEEQTEIVRRVEILFAYADRLAPRYSAARAQVEKLTPALLAKAFRGELVPQDPHDEPASALLQRLRAARATAPAKSKSLKGTTRRKKIEIEDLPMVAESRAVYLRKKRRA